jgi:hypothetical protein
MEHSGRDRYSSLVRALQAGREVPVGRTRSMPLEWHPIFRRLVLVAVAMAIAVVVVVNVHERWRAGLVEDWTGPGPLVQSGQRLDGCAATDAISHATMPVWVRYGGSVYVLTDARWALGNEGRPGETSLFETGYSLAEKRILLIDEPAAGAAPTRLVVARPPAYGGGLYLPHPECV